MGDHAAFLVGARRVRVVIVEAGFAKTDHSGLAEQIGDRLPGPVGPLGRLMGGNADHCMKPDAMGRPGKVRQFDGAPTTGKVIPHHNGVRDSGVGRPVEDFIEVFREPLIVQVAMGVDHRVGSERLPLLSLFFSGRQFGFDVSVLKSKDLKRKESRVGRPMLADGHRGDGSPARHLDGG